MQKLEEKVAKNTKLTDENKSRYKIGMVGMDGESSIVEDPHTLLLCVRSDR